MFGMGTGMAPPPWPPAFVLCRVFPQGAQLLRPRGAGKGSILWKRGRDMAKPRGLLVALGSARRRACTCALSTRCSPGGLRADSIRGDSSSRGGLPA